MDIKALMEAPPSPLFDFGGLYCGRTKERPIRPHQNVQYEPDTADIMRNLGGINMNGQGFVVPDEIDKVLIRMKDGREFEGGVTRAEYLPGPYGRVGYSELTVSTLKPTEGKHYGIQRVIFNNPATIVYWDDGTKTVVYCNDNMKDGKPQKADTFSEEVGLAMAIVKKQYGNVGGYNNIFREFIPEMKKKERAAKKAALKAKKAAKKAAAESTENSERSEENDVGCGEVGTGERVQETEIAE